jgi:hypothetical protein
MPYKTTAQNKIHTIKTKNGQFHPIGIAYSKIISTFAPVITTMVP